MEDYQVSGAGYSLQLKNMEGDIHEYIAKPLTDLQVDELDLWAVKELGEPFFSDNNLMATLAGVSRLCWTMIKGSATKPIQYHYVRTEYFGRLNLNKDDNALAITDAFDVLHKVEDSDVKEPEGNVE